MSDTKPQQTKLVELPASQIIDAIVKRYLAYIGWDGVKVDGKKRLINRPLVLQGPKGVGKSELPAQAAKKIQEILGGAASKPLAGQKVMTRSCNLQFLECPDLAGLPYVEKDADGVTITRHGRPDLLPRDGFGLWFLDEPNRAGRDIRSALLTLIQDRRVNDYPIGPNWMIVMAMNPPEAHGVSYEVGEWDAALQDRISPINFQGSVRELTTHLRSIYGDHPVIRWIESSGFDAETNKVVDFKGHGRCSPRGLEFMIRAIETEGGVDSPSWFQAASIEVGTENATVFSTYLRSIRTITGAEVVDGYNSEVEKKIQEFEADGRTDALVTLNGDIATLMVKRFEDGMKVGSPEFVKMMKNVCAYLEAAPAEARTAWFLTGGDRFNVLTDKTVFVKVCEFIAQNAPKLMAFLSQVKKQRALAKEQANPTAPK